MRRAAAATSPSARIAKRRYSGAAVDTRARPAMLPSVR